MALGSFDNTVLLFDAKTGASVATLGSPSPEPGVPVDVDAAERRTGHSGHVRGLAFDPVGKYLATQGAVDGSEQGVIVWNAGECLVQWCRACGACCGHGPLHAPPLQCVPQLYGLGPHSRRDVDGGGEGRVRVSGRVRGDVLPAPGVVDGRIAAVRGGGAESRQACGGAAVPAGPRH